MNQRKHGQEQRSARKKKKGGHGGGVSKLGGHIREKGESATLKETSVKGGGRISIRGTDRQKKMDLGNRRAGRFEVNHKEGKATGSFQTTNRRPPGSLSKKANK